MARERRWCDGDDGQDDDDDGGAAGDAALHAPRPRHGQGRR